MERLRYFNRLDFLILKLFSMQTILAIKTYGEITKKLLVEIEGGNLW